MAGEQTVRLTREQLYHEIWKLSIAGVAKKYGESYEHLIKLCKKAEIPTPSSGYWTKLKYGKSVEKIPLQESLIVEVVLPINNSFGYVIESPELEKEKNDNLDQEMETGEQENPPPYRALRGKYNTYDRETLYKEVWEKPVVKVAEQYGVSDVAIHKICKTLKVPTPSLGYWAKVRAGAVMKKIPLPKTQGASKITGVKTFEGIKTKETVMLEFLSKSEREQVFRVSQEITIPVGNIKFHKKIVAYQEVVKVWNRRDPKPQGMQRGRDNYSTKPPFLAGVISEDSLSRVYRILDTLFRQIEKLGGMINDDLSLQIRGEHIRIEISESQNKIDHMITKEEAQALLKYKEEERRNRLWAHKPQIRKYDYVFNGRLRIILHEGKYFKDSDKVDIESRLGEVLIALYEESERVRIEREAREEEARRQVEEEQREEKRRKKYNKEVERTISLENAALDYEAAHRIRSYVKAVLSSCGSDEMDYDIATWIEWAMRKADWFDPTVARDDEILGKRKHNKSPEEKILKQKRYW